MQQFTLDVAVDTSPTLDSFNPTGNEAAHQHLRLLSVSIDPLSDDAPTLARWLGRFGAQPARWSAAAPAVRDVDLLLDFLRGRAVGADRHTAQAYLFDRQGRLAFRTVDMPPGSELVRLMQELSAAG